MSLNVRFAYNCTEEIPHTSVFDYVDSSLSVSYTTDTPYSIGKSMFVKTYGYLKRYLPGTANGVIQLWFKVNHTSVHYNEIGFETPSGSIRIRIYQNGTINLYCPGGANPTASVGTIAYQWHYWVIEKNGSNVNVYFDGDLLLSDTTTATQLDSMFIFNSQDFVQYYVQHIVVHDGPYPGKELYLLPLNPTADVSQTNMTITGAASVWEAIKPPYTSSAYINSNLSSGQSANTRVQVTADALPPSLSISGVEAVVVNTVSVEDVATTSTIQAGLANTATNLGTGQTLKTTPHLYQFPYSQNPETGAPWSSISEADGFDIVVQHNHQ